MPTQRSASSSRKSAPAGGLSNARRSPRSRATRARDSGTPTLSAERTLELMAIGESSSEPSESSSDPAEIWNFRVGAGLVFAGVTDWCGMALLLARAPWNRRVNR